MQDFAAPCIFFTIVMDSKVACSEATWGFSFGAAKFPEKVLENPSRSQKKMQRKPKTCNGGGAARAGRQIANR